MRASAHLFELEKGWDIPLDPQYDSEQTLVLVFGPARLPEPLEKALDDLLMLFPRSVVMGCSSAGEIYQDQLSDDTLVVSVMAFEHTRLRCVSETVTDAAQSAELGQAMGKRLDGDGLVAVFTLTDGLLVNGSAYVDALGQALPDAVITGGMAADGDRFECTWTLFNGARHEGQLVACGLYGDQIKVGHASRGGWDLLGVDRQVTQSEANVLYALDGKPALALYKQYLGELADGLPGTGLRFPLALANEEAVDGITVRTILAVDEEAQSITFAGDIPVGATVRLMSANYDRLITGAGVAGEMLTEVQPAQNSVCVAISCVGRRLVLGARAEEELESVREMLPPGVDLLGYYSYGEISPLASGRCDLHNQTMTLTLFSETEA